MTNTANDEIWKPIAKWENLYEVSNLGRIRSIKRKRLANYGARDYGGRILSGCPAKDGYLIVNFRDASTGRHECYKVHSLVLKTFVSDRPDGLEARHKDGNQQNNKLENLAWGTKSENGLDRTMHGRSRGEKNHQSKLTEKQAICIKFSDGLHHEIAQQYGVSAALVSQIKRGVAWKHLAFCAQNGIETKE